jgi:DNA repair protein RadC
MKFIVPSRKCVLVADGRGFSMKSRPKASCVQDMAILCHKACGNSPNEEVHVFGIDGAGQIVMHSMIARGGISGASTYLSEVFRPLIIAGCPSFVISHNHPSGDPTPSTEDINLTEQVRKAGKILGVTCLDHLIVTQKRDRYFSMFERLPNIFYG